MNKFRRKSLEEIKLKLEQLQFDIDTLKDEEQQAHDNLPESIQYSEKGETMEDNVYKLEQAYDCIQQALDELDDIE